MSATPPGHRHCAAPGCHNLARPGQRYCRADHAHRMRAIRLLHSQRADLDRARAGEALRQGVARLKAAKGL